MRSETELYKIFEQEYTEIRRKNCIGCQHDKPSQKHHTVCLSDINRDIYVMKTLSYLLNKNKIDNEEFDFLNYSIKSTNTSCYFLEDLNELSLALASISDNYDSTIE